MMYLCSLDIEQQLRKFANVYSFKPKFSWGFDTLFIFYISLSGQMYTL